MQKERGTGGQGAGESRRQESGANKEAEGRRWVTQNVETVQIFLPLFYSSRKCYQLESKKGSFSFDDKWPGSVANFHFLPEAQFVAMCRQCVANCVFVCGLRGRVSRDERMPLSPSVSSQVTPWIIIMSTQQQIYLSIICSFWYFLFKNKNRDVVVPVYPHLFPMPGQGFSWYW